jgi:hypothetical protein
MLGMAIFFLLQWVSNAFPIKSLDWLSSVFSTKSLGQSSLWSKLPKTLGWSVLWYVVLFMVMVDPPWSPLIRALIERELFPASFLALLLGGLAGLFVGRSIVKPPIADHVKVLNHHPLLRRLSGWLFALTFVLAALGATRSQVPGLAVLGSVAALTGFVGLIIPPWLRSKYVRRRERKRLRRFLCPHCLHFGDFNFACGGCGGKVEEFVVHTNGAYADSCAHCQALLFSHDGADGVGIRAYCQRCNETCDGSIHHQRQVRVVGTLLSADFRPLCYNDGTSLTYVLNLTALDMLEKSQIANDYPNEINKLQTGSKNQSTYLLHLLVMPLIIRFALKHAHAVNALEFIWVDAARDDQQALALELGQAADRLIRQRASLPKARRRALAVCVPQTRLDPVVEHVLRTRFGSIRYGVALTDLAKGETAALKDVVVLEVGRQVADLALVTDIESAGSDVQAQAVKTLYGLDPDALPSPMAKHPSHRGGRFEVILSESIRHLRARHKFLCPHCLRFGGFHEFSCRVCRQKVEAFVVYTKGADVNACPNCHARLFSDDGLEAIGVQAYCKHCKATCDHLIYYERQVRVITALRQTDFASLAKTPGARKDQTTDGVAYVCGDDGERLNYVLDLSSVKAVWWLPRKHALQDSACVWLGADSDDPERLALELAKAADRFFSKTKQQKLTAYVPQATLPPVVRRVLESRFETVEYGVSAEQLLFNRVGEPEMLEARPAPEQVSLQPLKHPEDTGEAV